jgi:hypothetical protein
MQRTREGAPRLPFFAVAPRRGASCVESNASGKTPKHPVNPSVQKYSTLPNFGFMA